MTDKQEFSDLVICLNKIKDSYLALHILISNTLSSHTKSNICSLTPEQTESFWRIQYDCLIEQVILNHCKLHETLKRYGRILPTKGRAQLGAYFNNDRELALLRFRNKCSGHALDKKTMRPVDTSYLQELLSIIFGKNSLDVVVASFINKNDPSDPDTLVGIIENVIAELSDNSSEKHV